MIEFHKQNWVRMGLCLINFMCIVFLGAALGVYFGFWLGLTEFVLTIVIVVLCCVRKEDVIPNIAEMIWSAVFCFVALVHIILLFAIGGFYHKIGMVIGATIILIGDLLLWGFNVHICWTKRNSTDSSSGGSSSGGQSYLEV